MNPLALLLLQGADSLPPWQQAMQAFFTGPMMTAIGIWIGAGLTLFMFSFIYKDNPFFKFGEYLYLGISAGYGSTIYWFSYIKPKLIYPLMPTLDPKYGTPEGTLFNPWVLIPAIMGMFIIMRLVPGKAWMSRITFAFLIGGGTGIGLPLVVLNLFLPQFSATVQAVPWRVTDIDSAVLLLNSIILLVGAITVLVYFFFSVEHRGFTGGVSRVGIYFLMIAFGASFGYTIMARISLLIGRIQFLMFDWIGDEVVGRFAMLFRGG